MAEEKGIRIGAAAGTYDGFTIGHRKQIEEAAEQVDELVVGIGDNPEKEGKTYFNLEKRLWMVREGTKHISNVRVVAFNNQYLVDFAEEVGASVIFRGLRNEKDFNEEMEWQTFNRNRKPNIRTVFIIPEAGLRHISSSYVKQLIGPKGWVEEVAKCVPEATLEAFREWYANKGMRTELFERFKNLWLRIGATSDPRDVFNFIEIHYNERHRAYHTLYYHIKKALDEFDKVKDLVEDPDVLELAIFFHDLVDSHGASDNEQKSAKISRLLMEMADLPTKFVDKVAERILASDHRKKEKPQDIDSMIMIDIDLSILGQDRKTYQEYEKKIREEYKFHGFFGEEYRKGRGDFLRMMLEPGRKIFLTAFFRDRYEAQAIENMRRALELLEQT